MRINFQESSLHLYALINFFSVCFSVTGLPISITLLWMPKSRCSLKKEQSYAKLTKFVPNIIRFPYYDRGFLLARENFP